MRILTICATGLHARGPRKGNRGVRARLRLHLLRLVLDRSILPIPWLPLSPVVSWLPFLAAIAIAHGGGSRGAAGGPTLPAALSRWRGTVALLML